MCGLVGVAGYISQKEEKVFERLLEIDTIRGPHSTGILVVNQKGEANVVKKVGTPWDLYQYKAYDDVMRGSLNVLMGHNRFATKGKITSKNAHPFEHDHVIGAHNGTLRAQHLLAHNQRFDVDSDNIFHSIANEGVDETVKKLAGAFALTWYDSEQETMNFIRNEERPLWLAESEDERTVFWASERWMVEITLQLAGIKYKEPFEPKAGMLFSYPIELAFVPKAFPEVAVRTLELHKWPVYQAPINNNFYGGKPVQQGNPNMGKPQGKVTANDLMLKDKVEFSVSSIRTSSHTGQQWVSCQVEDPDCTIELRLYTSDAKLIEQMANSTNTFTGKCRSFATMGNETYCTLDPRTIVEVEGNVEEDEEEFAVVYGGAIVSEDDYEVLTCCGCINCKTVPSLDDSIDLTWIDEENFICLDCIDLPVVQEFVSRSIKSTNHSGK